MRATPNSLYLILVVSLALFEGPHRAAFAGDYASDRDQMMSIELEVAKSIAQELHDKTKELRPKIVLENSPNGAPVIIVEFVVPPLSQNDDNYIGRWTQHWIVSLACQDAVEDFCKSRNFESGEVVANIAQVRAGLEALFLQDQQAFTFGNPINFQQGLNAYAHHNVEQLQSSVLGLCQAEGRAFGGFRLPQNVSLKVQNRPRTVKELEESMKAVQSRNIMVKAPAANKGIVEFVSELERRIYEHRKIEQGQWNWRTVGANNVATLVPGSVYCFRIGRNPAKCYTMLVGNNGVELPNK